MEVDESEWGEVKIDLSRVLQLSGSFRESGFREMRFMGDHVRLDCYANSELVLRRELLLIIIITTMEYN